MKQNQHHFLGLLLTALAGLMGVGLTGCTDPSRGGWDPESLRSDGSEVRTAYQVLLAGLADAHPNVRTSAIEAVAVTRAIPLAPKLGGLVRDPVVPVRFAALVAVGDLQYRPAQAACRQILDEPQEDPSVRLAAAYALVRLGHPQALEPIRQALAHTQPQAQSNAAFLLGKVGDRQSIVALRRLLKLPGLAEQTSRQIILSLAQLQDPEVYQTLWSLLISVFADDRIDGIRGMGFLGHDQARKAIATLLDDDVLEVRLAAAEELAKLGDFQGEPVVYEILLQEVGPTSGPTARSNDAARIRRTLMAALAAGQMRSERTRRLLPALLQDPAAVVRIAAAEALLLSQTQPVYGLR